MMGGDSMLKALKSYWAFTNSIYKIVMLGLVPLALIVGCMLLTKDGAGDSLLFLFALFVVDTESDFFFMNGTYYRGQEFSNFMQSSSKCICIIKEATVVDIVRRVVIFQIPFWVEVVFAVGDEGRMQWCRLNAFWPWLAIFVAQSVVFVMRHFIEWVKVHFCMTMGFISMMILFVIMAELFAGNLIVNGVLIIAVFVVSVGTVWYTEKKGKERYYD